MDLESTGCESDMDEVPPCETYAVNIVRIMFGKDVIAMPFKQGMGNMSSAGYDLAPARLM